MSTSFKSSRNTLLHLSKLDAEKNDLHTGPINDDLPSVNTWGTPQMSLFTRRSHHHDA
jgi:hypothetical protein